MNIVLGAHENMAGGFETALAESTRKDLVISDQTSYNFVCSVLKEVVALKNHPFLQDLRTAKSELHQAWKHAVARLDKYESAIAIQEASYKVSLLTWDQEQERLRLEEQRRLDAEASQRAQEEALEAGLAAEAEGATAEEVDAILEEQQAPVAVVAPQTYQPASGISKPSNRYSGRIINLLAFARHIVDNPAEANMLLGISRHKDGLGGYECPSLNRRADSQKGLFIFPGCELVTKHILAVRVG